MGKPEISGELAEYNRILRENDGIYRHAARAFGLSDCALWILYVLRTETAPITQSGICDILYQPKQTVNSALKKMEEDGLLTFICTRGQRSKPIRLTEKGALLAAETADRIIQAEQDAFFSLSGEERETFLRVWRKYTAQLKKTVQHMKKSGASLE